MIISKAIETNTDLERHPIIATWHDSRDAIKLGIEALKRLEQGRLHPFNPMYSPLPGESMPERGIQAGLQSRQSKKTK